MRRHALLVAAALALCLAVGAGRVALFGEAVYTLEGRSLNLSTAPRVYPPVPAD